MFAYQKMAWSTDQELARFSSAMKSLACSEGLPGTERRDFRACIGKIKEMAEKVRWSTVKNFRQFYRRPQDYNYSKSYFRDLVLVSTLQKECGVRYNPAKIPEDVPLDAADMFVYGAVLGEGGTCASLPVLYRPLPITSIILFGSYGQRRQDGRIFLLVGRIDAIGSISKPPGRGSCPILMITIETRHLKDCGRRTDRPFSPIHDAAAGIGGVSRQPLPSLPRPWTSSSGGRRRGVCLFVDA